MNQISPQHLLQQIRSLNAELQGTVQRPPAGASETGFGTLLQQSLDAVNRTQQTANTMKSDFERGTGDASLVEVMVATQKADLSFRAMTEARNKLVTAYQEIMNMPV